MHTGSFKPDLALPHRVFLRRADEDSGAEERASGCLLRTATAQGNTESLVNELQGVRAVNRLETGLGWLT